jgi:hypothetical protein
LLPTLPQASFHFSFTCADDDYQLCKHQDIFWCESFILRAYRILSSCFFALSAFSVFPLPFPSVKFITSAAVGKLLFLASHRRALRADDLQTMTTAACNNYVPGEFKGLASMNDLQAVLFLPSKDEW